MTEINFAYSHKFAERMLTTVNALSDNVTRVEAGVTLGNALTSAIDSTSPAATLAVVTEMRSCFDCSIPSGETKSRPWFSDDARDDVVSAITQGYYKHMPSYAEARSPSHLTPVPARPREEFSSRRVFLSAHASVSSIPTHLDAFRLQLTHP